MSALRVAMVNKNRHNSTPALLDIKSSSRASESFPSIKIYKVATSD